MPAPTPQVKIRTSSDLKLAIEQAGTCPHLFTRRTMSFFGDTMRNYGVRSPRTITTRDNVTVRVYELYRRRPVKRGLQTSMWFNAETFERVARVKVERSTSLLPA